MSGSWLLVQLGDRLVMPPRIEFPPAGAFGSGDSITGTCVMVYDSAGKVLRAYEDGTRARWNGRFCLHGNGFGCDDCKTMVREQGS